MFRRLKENTASHNIQIFPSFPDLDPFSESNLIGHMIILGCSMDGICIAELYENVAKQRCLPLFSPIRRRKVTYDLIEKLRCNNKIDQSNSIAPLSIRA